MTKYLLLLFIGLAYWGCEDKQDTIPPTVSISYPLPNTTVSEMVAIKCLSSDNEGIKRVELWVNGAPTGVVDDTGPYSLNWNTTLVDNESYNINVRSYDTSENTTDSEPIVLAVDNTQSNPTPVNITSVVFDNGGFTITWDESTDGDFDSYKLESSTDSTMNSPSVVFTTESLEQTTYFDTDVNPLISQFYRVTVIDTFDFETKGEIGDAVLDECGEFNGDNESCNYMIEGYLDKISYYPAETAILYINSQYSSSSTSIDIYNINDLIVHSISGNIFSQNIQNEEPWVNGYGYEETLRFYIPSLSSGLYFIKIGDTGWKIPLIIKTSDYVDAIIVYPSNTINAYNKREGYSFYTDPKTPILSFLRPQNLPSFSIPFFEWAEIENFNFGYITDYDLDSIDHFSNSNILIIPGHNEYWSRNARENFDNFVHSGNDAIVLSGNTMWWQIRYENKDEQLVCYKAQGVDPIDDPLLETILWTTPQLEYSIISSIGADFNGGGYGLKYDDLGWDGYKIILPQSPLFNGLNIENNQVLSIPTTEYDGAPLNGFLDDGTPIIDNDLLGFYKIELLGYDVSYRNGNKYPTFIAFQKNELSGTIINAASTNWCSDGIDGIDGEKIKIITFNMINLLLQGESIFQTD